MRALALVADAWRAVTRRKLLWTSVLGLLGSMATIATQTGYFRDPVPLTPSINAVLSLQFNGFAVLFAVLVADRVSSPSAPRWWAYAIAVAVGVLVGSSLMWLVSQRILHLTTSYEQSGAAEGFDTFFFRHGSHAFMLCGMVACIYAVQRLGSLRAATLGALQLECALAERRIVESRLAAARARLEPQFVLHTLGEVERLYAVDPRNADRVLKELTAYLRATIPVIREPASTVATEVRITNAFLNVLAKQSRDRVRLASGTDLANRARMMPMILLPLVQHAIDCRPLAMREEATLTINLAADGVRLVMTIRDRGPGFSPHFAGNPAMGQVRDRLVELYGERGKLTMRDETAGSSLIVEFPLEHTSRHDGREFAELVPSGLVPRLAERVRP
jgi:hypothetical protein